MKRYITLLIAAMAIVLILAFAAGCGEGARVGELQTKNETIERGDASSVDVEIDMGAGELTIEGGSSDLLEARFTYNVEELNPSAVLSNGKLVVTHEDVKSGIGTFFDLPDYRNEWDLRFSDSVPMEMRIDLGAGRTDIALGTVELSRLDINAGAGDVSLDLSDSRALNHLDFDMGAGEVLIDLSGDWQDDLDALIQGGVGELTLKLPASVGVRVHIDSGIGGVDSSGLSKDGDVYTNDAYGDSAVTLTIEIDAGVGQINLDVE